MKKYYVAFFPEISEDHWVSQFRYQHDEKSHLVAPHITLFFPAEMESSEELLNEANRVAISSPKFSVRFRSVMMMPERGSTGLVSYLFFGA